MTPTAASHCSRVVDLLPLLTYNDNNNINRDGMANDEQPGGEDHDNGHHHSTPNRHCEQLLVG
jgi:hypothetical protein